MRRTLAFTAVLLLAGVTFAMAQAIGDFTITKLNVENVTGNSAVVAFSTTRPSSTVIAYGTDPNNLSQSAQAPWGGTDHHVTLNNLQPDTTYYWQVRTGQAQGTNGGEVRSGVQNFKTTAASASAMPQSDQGNANQLKLTKLAVENVTGNSAQVAFSTNDRSSTVIAYGTDPNNLDQTAEAKWGGKSEQNGFTHRVTINNLKPNTTYYWQVRTAQGQGTSGAELRSGVQTFVTKPS
jgi:phosphodiesterase/alkaline phosphatase D-like protein